MSEHAPASDIDPFSDDFLADPYPFHEALREAGPVVWLDRYGIFAAARYSEAQSALQDWRTFSSESGVGLANLSREEVFRPRSVERMELAAEPLRRLNTTLRGLASLHLRVS